MIEGYANPGQKPFQLSPTGIKQDKDARKRAREQNKAHYKLGMPKITHSVCKKCGRKIVGKHDCEVITPVLMVEQMKCPKCETLVLVDASYCHCCGKWLKE